MLFSHCNILLSNGEILEDAYLQVLVTKNHKQLQILSMMVQINCCCLALLTLTAMYP